MQTRGKKARFLFPECSLHYAKVYYLNNICKSFEPFSLLDICTNKKNTWTFFAARQARPDGNEIGRKGAYTVFYPVFIWFLNFYLLHLQ